MKKLLIYTFIYLYVIGFAGMQFYYAYTSRTEINISIIIAVVAYLIAGYIYYIDKTRKLEINFTNCTAIASLRAASIVFIPVDIYFLITEFHHFSNYSILITVILAGVALVIAFIMKFADNVFDIQGIIRKDDEESETEIRIRDISYLKMFQVVVGAVFILLTIDLCYHSLIKSLSYIHSFIISYF